MTLRHLALGDSYTIGEGVAVEGRWPVQLAARLREAGVPMDEPRIIATTGWTTDELSTAMDAIRFEPPYDLVSLLIGVNDQYRGRLPESYREPFTQLLRRAVSLAGDRPGHVLVLSIPDWGVTPFARDRDTTRIAAELDAYNAIARDITLMQDTHWVGVTSVSRDHADLLADDGLHPSAAQYALWAAAALPVAHHILTHG